MSRFAFLAGRARATALLLFVILAFTFLLIHITPGDPARAVAGETAPPEAIAQVREELGLDDSLPQQFWRYVSSLAQGDMGESNQGSFPVATVIGDSLPTTLWLLFGGALLAVLISVPLAVVSAVRRDRPVDHSVRIGSLLGLAVPPFWSGFMLLILIAIPTGWFPVGGFEGNPAEKLRAMVLPSLTLAMLISPFLIRSLRSTLIDVLASEYVAAARSVGVDGWRLIVRHVLRNAIAPLVVLLTVQLGFLLFGAVIVEQTFALQGIGQELVIAAAARDFPVVQGITLVFAVIVVTLNIAADAVLAWLDPRVTVS